MKVDDLKGRDLDTWVARAEGFTVEKLVAPLPDTYVVCKRGADGFVLQWPGYIGGPLNAQYQPSTDPAQGQPIMERERISVFENEQRWRAAVRLTSRTVLYADGNTQLEAAMRVRVAQVFGDTVEAMP